MWNKLRVGIEMWRGLVVEHSWGSGESSLGQFEPTLLVGSEGGKAGGDSLGTVREGTDFVGWEHVWWYSPDQVVRSSGASLGTGLSTVPLTPISPRPQCQSSSQAS